MKVFVSLTMMSPLLTLFGCVPQPKQDYSVNQVAQISSLAEIMRVQAHDMDPLFGKRDQPSYTAAEFVAMLKAAARTDAASLTIKEKFAGKFDQGFVTFAQQLNSEAKRLHDAASAQQGGDVSAALKGMLQACKGCHKKYK